MPLERNKLEHIQLEFPKPYYKDPSPIAPARRGRNRLQNPEARREGCWYEYWTLRPISDASRRINGTGPGG